MSLTIDPEAVIQAVRSQVSRALEAQTPAATRKSDGSWVTQVDLDIQHGLQSWLGRHYPETGFLGEEMSPDRQQAALAEDRPVWVLDPLDGTSNFRMGLPAYATSLALLERGQPVFGLVHDPCRNETFSARRGAGAQLNGAPMKLAPDDAPPLCEALAGVDFKRLPKALATRLANAPPYASQRSIGSIALEWCWVATGRFAVYVHGRQGLWDYAAGQLILSEAGGHFATLTGPASDTLDLRPRSAVCAASPDLMREWQAWLRLISSP
ncbi:inositol monophosphatase family protein [Ectothiorhodospira lacustris]|uniref:inositol monophosphatase family protein n=1 Tax=Ectothiorhodospira lacustris TaxID=2899127 RepID=UPI001EE7C2EC|nr:inositol monophosphatase family protein [Ectothiorhodospira lacustris]MCG5500826.1 inositol monophosphatase family protein [Ectothiorhodospira lacustris]MCG5510607.1 inositol monophosphatase family protein [Ectothiorhodospira lacustris]MCG5521299.1 inositol monophosphatase family protein [Ectothiorhodospira lacustris]